MDAADAGRGASAGWSVPVSVLGWSHRGAPLEVLEAVAVPQGQRARLLARLAAVDREVVLLSTCSRTEVYTATAATGPELLRVVARDRGCDPAQLEASVEHRTGAAAVEHLFRVTAGLESRIAGEQEVCGQVRRAVRDARRAATLGPVLAPPFGAAVRCAQQVRDVSGLGTSRCSWGARAVAVGLAGRGPAPAPQVVVVGSGRLATTVVAALGQRGVAPVVVARDLETARRLAGPRHARPLTALADVLVDADVVCCTTSAPGHVVPVAVVRTVLAERPRRLTVLDLSVPRNVDPQVGDLPGVTLLGPQDLADDGDPRRVAALEAGSVLVRVLVERHVTALAVRRAGPLLDVLRRHVSELCLAELQRAAPRDAPADELARTAHLLAVRLLQRPTLAARAAAAAGDATVLHLLADAFGLPGAGRTVPSGPVGADGGDRSGSRS